MLSTLSRRVHPVFYDDFSQYAEDTFPDNWSYNSSSDDDDYIEVINQEANKGDRVFVMKTIDVRVIYDIFGGRYFSDSDQLMLLRITDNMAAPRLLSRVIRSVGRHGYEAMFRGTSVEVAKYNENNGGTFVSQSHSFAYTSGDWVWLRFRNIGNSIKVKAWKYGDNEPSSWLINTTDNDHTSGEVGMGQWLDKLEVDYYSVGFAGKPAETQEG